VTTMGQVGERRSFTVGLGEVAGAVADLGVFVPLAAALILVNGLDPGAVLLSAGLLVMGSGAFFGIPFPVQPLKALTAVAVAQTVAPEVIHAAGLEIAALLLLLSVHRIADAVARVFTRPVVRALQFGVGALLVWTAVRLATDPPGIFLGTPGSPWPALLAAVAFAGVGLAARFQRYEVALLLLVGGIVAAVLAAAPEVGAPAFHLPAPSWPPATAFAEAFLLLVVPQVPLTFGNAVVAVDDVAHRYLGSAARRVSPSRVTLSCGLGNVISGVLGGMPMCHGAGGLTAHVRLGARTAGMNLLLGSALVGLGLFFAAQVPVLLGLLPVWVLSAFLAYAGLRHAMLVADLRRAELLVAVVAGGVGALTGNLAVTAGLALLAAFTARVGARYLSPRRDAHSSSSSNASSSEIGPRSRRTSIS
jgi:sulfate permease, SulP family